mmetsp:Transcript_16200/g.44851  ORF Transcript_16200/g.44851 Transcript_16200/m.44851 type:complete len:203 (-) Transcript_16200:804-1412(-)
MQEAPGQGCHQGQRQGGDYCFFQGWSGGGIGGGVGDGDGGCGTLRGGTPVGRWSCCFLLRIRSSPFGFPGAGTGSRSRSRSPPRSRSRSTPRRSQERPASPPPSQQQKKGTGSGSGTRSIEKLVVPPTLHRTQRKSPQTDRSGNAVFEPFRGGGKTRNQGQTRRRTGQAAPGPLDERIRILGARTHCQIQQSRLDGARNPRR